MFLRPQAAASCHRAPPAAPAPPSVTPSVSTSQQTRAAPVARSLPSQSTSGAAASAGPAGPAGPTGRFKAVEAWAAEDEPELKSDGRRARARSLPRDDVVPEEPEVSTVEEETYQPAWKRKNLEKELEEISAIEATAIAIRQGLQDLQEEKDTCDVDADAAALMLELRGGRSTKTAARRSSSVGDHEAMALLAELQAVKESGRSQVNEGSEAAQSDRPWHLEVMKMRKTLNALNDAKDT